jgi:hypothetical protein
MGSTYEIVQEDGYRRIVVLSTVTVEDFILDHEAPQPRLWILPESMSGFGLDDLREIGRAGESLHVDGRSASVAPSEYVFGLARQGTMLRRDDSDRHRVFHTEAEALEWLGFPLEASPAE